MENKKMKPKKKNDQKFKLIPLFILFLLMGIGAFGFQKIVKAERINPTTDLTYLGAFRISDNNDWGIRVGTGLTYYPSGDPSGPDDGFPGSLFIIKRPYVFEISIPTPVISKNPQELPVASILSNPKEITGDVLTSDPFWTEQSDFNNLGDVEYVESTGNGRPAGLFWSEWKYYNVGGVSYDSLGWSTLDMSKAYGLWHVGPRTEEFHGNRSGAYLFTIDKDWADAHLQGKYLATGRHRANGAFGGSKGPTVFVVSPWEGNEPPEKGTALDTIALMYYTANDQFPDYSPLDQWTGATWIHAGSNDALLISGLKGTGSCYGAGTSDPSLDGKHVNGTHVIYCYDPCRSQDKGYHSYPYSPRLLWYDPADLAAVAQGNKQPWEVVPYSEWTPLDILWKTDECSTGLGGAAFDRNYGLLYIVERGAYKVGYQAKSIIHVWKVNSSNLPDLTPPTLSNGSPSGTLSADTTSTTLSITTNENATCRYSTTTGTSYDSMTNTFTTTGGTNHSTTITGLTNGGSYTYYIRCQDEAGNANTTDYPISFSIANPTPVYTIDNFISLITHWLGIGDQDSDVNNDGIVNARDLGIMMHYWK